MIELEGIIKTVRSALDGGNDCYLVGGCVRDLIIGRPLKDIDFAVSKNPKLAAAKTAKHFEGPLITLAEDQEIYRTIIKEEGIQIDFAKFKGGTIEEDLSNRDFTINAMALGLNGPLRPENIFDPGGGKEDIEKKIIRQISPKIYAEDPLRLLRAFRIAAQIGFEINPDTFETIKKNSSLITQSAAERIREEILLLLEVPNAYPHILNLDHSGLISSIFPEIDPNRTCALDYYPGKGVWGHSLDTLKYLEWIFENLEKEFPKNQRELSSVLCENKNDTDGHSIAAIMKLAALLHDVGKAPTAKMIEGRLRFYEHQNVGAKITRSIAKRLKFSAHANQNCSKIVESHMRPGGLAFAANLTDKAKYRFFRDLGENAVTTLIVSLADRYTYLSETEIGKGSDPHEKIVKEMVEWHYRLEEERARKPAKLLDGNILMRELNLPPSPLIGHILKEAEEAQALGEIHTLEEALTLAKKIVDEKVKS